MKSFSQRKGLKPVKSVVQVDSMDDDLRHSLWNTLCHYFWRDAGIDNHKTLDYINIGYFKKPADIPLTYQGVREYFLSCEWNEVFDLLEFIVLLTVETELFRFRYRNIALFVESCNSVLERELSAYRLIGGKFVQITDEAEIRTLDEALHTPIQQVKDHLAASLSLLADRENPDYRNSIKEAISAVEATAKIITGDKKATLRQALKRLGLHPALESGLSSIYGYTSDADGIRHALTDEPNVTHDDAKFMLVSCSAFVNYLIARANKAGIQLT